MRACVLERAVEVHQVPGAGDDEATAGQLKVLSMQAAATGARTRSGCQTCALIAPPIGTTLRHVAVLTYGLCMPQALMSERVGGMDYESPMQHLRLYVRIEHVEPSELPPDWLGRVATWLEDL